MILIIKYLINKRSTIHLLIYKMFNGNYYIIDEISDNQYFEILSDKISLSYTSSNYQYI